MSCRFVASDQPRAITGRHVEDCLDDQCSGCQPCLDAHCRVCHLAHIEGTCPECMTETREALHEIARMCGALPDEVEHRGTNGEAMFLLGPVADPEARGHLEASVAAGRVSPDYLAEAIGENHPLWVLGTWDMVWRDALEHDGTELVTIVTAADYLDRTMTYMSGYPHVPFEEFARDLRKCAGHLAAVLHDGEQIEKGAPCLTCKRPVTLTTTDKGVTSHCDRCNRTLTANEYRLAVHAAFIAHAVMLSADDMAFRIAMPASTIRRWANVRRFQRAGEDPVEAPPLMRSCGRDAHGRKVYRVEDAQAIKDDGGDHRGSGTVSIEGVA